MYIHVGTLYKGCNATLLGQSLFHVGNAALRETLLWRVVGNQRIKSVRMHLQ